MTDVRFVKLAQKPSKSGSSVTTRRMSKDGRLVTVRSVDANSSSFTSDLLQVFQKNVARARRRNRKLLGSSDRAPAGD